MIGLILTLVVVGVVLYLLTLIPMDDAIKQIIRVAVILLAVLYVIAALTGYHVPGLRLR